MSVVIATAGAGVFALVLIGGSILRRVFTAPEPMSDSRQYWS